MCIGREADEAELRAVMSAVEGKMRGTNGCAPVTRLNAELPSSVGQRRRPSKTTGNRDN